MRLWQEDEYEGESERAHAAVEEEGDGGVAVRHVSEEKGEKGVCIKKWQLNRGRFDSSSNMSLKSGEISEAVQTEIIAAAASAAAAAITAAATATITITAAAAAETTNTPAATAATTVPV